MVDFWVDLGKITGLEAPEAQKVAELVRNAYLDDIQYLREEKKPEKRRLGMEPSGQIDTSTAIPPAEKYAKVMKVLIEEGAFKIAKDFLDHIESKSGQKDKNPKEEG